MANTNQSPGINALCWRMVRTVPKKLTYAPQRGMSFSQWPGRLNLRRYAPLGRCQPRSRPSKVKGGVFKAVT
jgi:hypothetical protein